MAGPPTQPLPGSPPPADDEAQEAAARRTAQDAAADLARMGIDPQAVGLAPVPPTAPPQLPPRQGTAQSAGPGTAPSWSAYRQHSWIQPFGGTTPGAANAVPDPAPHPQAGTGPAPAAVTPGVPLWPGAPDGPAPPTAPANAPIPALAAPAAPNPSAAPAERHDIVVPAGWRRLIRAATFGVVTPGAAETMAAERQLVQRARARQRAPKVVAFLAGKGGVGTTTTAIGVALTLAALRNVAGHADPQAPGVVNHADPQAPGVAGHTDPQAPGGPAVLVDARNGASSLGRRAAGRPAPTTLEVTGAATEVAAVQPLALPSGLHLVDGAPWHSPPSRAEFVRLLDQLPTRFPFTLVDIGNETADAARGALALASRVVLVTTPTADALESVRTALARIVQANPAALASVVIALVHRSRKVHRQVARRLTGELGLSHVVAVPYDRSLALGQQVAPTRMRAATREAYLTLAAHVADTADAPAHEMVPLVGSPDGLRRPGE